MNWGRNIYVDLIDKKLWPIAVLLLLALVTIPGLLSNGAAPKPSASDTAAQTQVAPPAGLPAPGTAVTLANNDVGTERVTGSSHDPFKQASGTVSTATTGSTIGGTTATTGTTSATTGTVATTTGGATPGSFATGTTGTTTGVENGSGTADTTTTADQPEARTQVILRFGVAQGSRPQRSVDSLVALPSASSPLFVYLGSVAKDTRAVFLVSADAVPTGDGRCSPNKKVCSQIDLQAGDTEYFDVKTSKGTVQYQLDVVGLHKVT